MDSEKYDDQNMSNVEIKQDIEIKQEIEIEKHLIDNNLCNEFCNKFYQKTEYHDLFIMCDSIKINVIQQMFVDPLTFFQKLWKTMYIIPYDNQCQFYYNLRSVEDKFFKPIIGANAMKNKNILCLSCKRIQILSNYRIGLEYQLFNFFESIIKVSHTPFYPIVNIYQSNNKNIIQLDENTNRIITSWIVNMDKKKNYFFVNNLFDYICCGQLTQIDDYKQRVDLDDIDINKHWKLILIQLIFIAGTLMTKKIIHGDIKMENFIISSHDDSHCDENYVTFKDKEYYLPFAIQLQFTGKSQVEIDNKNIIKKYSVFDQQINIDSTQYDIQFEQIMKCFLTNEQLYELISSDDDIYRCIWKDEDGTQFNNNCMLDLVNML